MIVRVVRQPDDEYLGTIEVDGPEELKMIAATDWRPFEMDGRLRSFRFHGYWWDSGQGGTVGTLWVSEGE